MRLRDVARWYFSPAEIVALLAFLPVTLAIDLRFLFRHNLGHARKAFREGLGAVTVKTRPETAPEPETPRRGPRAAPQRPTPVPLLPTAEEIEALPFEPVEWERFMLR